jgi:hypothetical protein
MLTSGSSAVSARGSAGAGSSAKDHIAGATVLQDVQPHEKPDWAGDVGSAETPGADMGRSTALPVDT